MRLLDVLYLAGNTGDSAVERRVRMLQEGGALVSVAGFRRAGSAAPRLEVEHYHELGQTFEDPDGYRIVIQHAAWEL